MAKNPFEDAIEKAWMERNDISPQTSGEIRDAIEKTLDSLDCGTLRVAEKKDSGEWVVNEWAKGTCVWGEVKKQYNEYFKFEGNFCRSILRLVNLFRNIEAIAVMTKKSDLVNKIKGYHEKLSRDIVTTDSLYI